MKEWKSVHFIGIGGTGLSAIARVMLESGYQVTGSDRSMSPLAMGLQEAGVRIDIGHRADNILGAQVVVRSSAIPDDNVEVMAAHRQGIPVLKRSEFLSILMEGRLGIAVAGTHGKTTTTAMIAWMLIFMKQDPTFIVGGVLNNLGTNAHAGNGEAFVIEADEYDRMFLGLKPKLAVITNIEHDHPDCYPTKADFFNAFEQFAAQVWSDGLLLVCANDSGATRLGEIARQHGQKVDSYAIRDGDQHQSANYLGENITVEPDGGMSFDMIYTSKGGDSERYPGIRLQVPGLHNVQNAVAALGVAHQMHLPLSQAAESLAEFRGTGRRFEIRAQVGGITVIDDYAHHPTEIRVTLAAARARYPQRRLWVVWQPHTYSRTRLLFDDFAIALELADQVIVTDIYAAREMPPEDGFSSRHVVTAMADPKVRYMSDFSEVAGYLVEKMKAGEVLIVLSAGDADQISKQVALLLQERSEKDE
jgi:UDP-N-acetylmuramate--alanine ligase